MRPAAAISGPRPFWTPSAISISTGAWPGKARASRFTTRSPRASTVFSIRARSRHIQITGPRLMAPNVLDPGPSRPGSNLHAQCLPGHLGGVTLLAINTSTTGSRSMELPLAAERYTLAAEKVEPNRILLNGQEHKLGANDELPTLQAQHITAGQVEHAPTSISFFAIEGADNPSCR